MGYFFSAAVTGEHMRLLGARPYRGFHVPDHWLQASV
jgi:hypothetical protein